jgi:hypothetical protein
MKVNTPIGSKQRLVEIFQTVNKVKINEDLNQSNDSLNNSFEQLKTNQLNIKNVQTQVTGDKSFIKVSAVNENNNTVEFNFETIAEESDQDNVLKVNDVKLNNFKIMSVDGNVIDEMGENELANFNAEHGDELFDVIGEYTDTESDLETEMYEEAIKKIDSYPFGGGSERMQTGKAYADEKPTNDDLRVSDEELNKYIDEAIANLNGVKAGDTFMNAESNDPYQINSIDQNNQKAIITSKNSGDKFQVSVNYLLNNFEKMPEHEYNIDENQEENDEENANINNFDMNFFNNGRE